MKKEYQHIMTVSTSLRHERVADAIKDCVWKSGTSEPTRERLEWHTESFFLLYGVFLTARNPVACSELEVLNSDEEIQVQGVRGTYVI